MVDSNFAFIDPVSAVYYGGRGGGGVRLVTRIPKWLLIDNYVEPAVIWRTHTAAMDKYHLH